MFIGAAHRKSIKEKAHQYQSKSKPNWNCGFYQSQI